MIFVFDTPYKSNFFFIQVKFLTFKLLKLNTFLKQKKIL